MDKFKFLNPKDPYRGEVKSKDLVFNANIQEFSSQVNHICDLEINGKISSAEAYERTHTLWKKLEKSKKELEIKDPKI